MGITSWQDHPSRKILWTLILTFIHIAGTRGHQEAFCPIHWPEAVKNEI